MPDGVIIPVIPHPVVTNHDPKWFLWTMIGLYGGALVVGAVMWLWSAVSDWRFYRKHR